MFSFSGQFFYEHVFKHKDGLRWGPNVQKKREDTFFISLKTNTGYHKERIIPDLLFVYDIATSCWYVKPTLTFKYGDHWRQQIEALIWDDGDGGIKRRPGTDCRPAKLGKPYLHYC